MSATCPNGHASTADDYCDVCGAPIDASAVAAAGASGLDLDGADGAAADAGDAATGSTPGVPDADTATPAGQVCPDCSTVNIADALFCEGCGYDFTTRTSARGADAAADAAADRADKGAASDGAADAPAVDRAFEWVAEVWIDPAWYGAQQATDQMPSPGLPAVVPLRKTSLLVGRRSQSRNIEPDIDCEPDTAASRRQAQLTTDGTRWFVEDLQSANGTFVGPASGALPDDPIAAGPKHELQPDDRVYVGAWTRIVVRRATRDEQSTL